MPSPSSSSSPPPQQQEQPAQESRASRRGSFRTSSGGITHESQAMRNFQVAATIAHGLSGHHADNDLLRAHPRTTGSARPHIHSVVNPTEPDTNSGAATETAEVVGERTETETETAVETTSGTLTPSMFQAQAAARDQEQDQRLASLTGRLIVEEETGATTSTEPEAGAADELTPTPTNTNDSAESSGQSSDSEGKALNRRQRRSSERRQAQDDRSARAERRAQQHRRHRFGLGQRHGAGAAALSSSSGSGQRRLGTMPSRTQISYDDPRVLHVETLEDLHRFQLRSQPTSPLAAEAAERRAATPEPHADRSEGNDAGVAMKPATPKTPVRSTLPAPSKQTFTFESSFKLPLGSRPAPRGEGIDVGLGGHSRDEESEDDYPTTMQDRPPSKARRRAEVQSPMPRAPLRRTGVTSSEAEPGSIPEGTFPAPPDADEALLEMLDKSRSQLAGFYRQGFRYVTIACLNIKIEILNEAGDTKSLGYVVPLGDDFFDWSDEEEGHRIPSEPDDGFDTDGSEGKQGKRSSSDLEPYQSFEPAPGMTRDEDSQSTLAPATPGDSPQAGVRRSRSLGGMDIVGRLCAEQYRPQARIITDSDEDDDGDVGGDVDDPQATSTIYIRGINWQTKKRRSQLQELDEETSSVESHEPAYRARHIPRQTDDTLDYDEEIVRHDFDRGSRPLHSSMNMHLMDQMRYFQPHQAPAFESVPPPPPSPPQQPMSRQQRRHQGEPQFGSRWREKKREIIPSNRPSRVVDEAAGNAQSGPSGAGAPVIKEEAPLRKYSSTDHSSLPRDKMARNLRARQTAPRIFQRDEGVDRLRLLLDAPPEEKERRRPWAHRHEGRKAIEASGDEQRDEKEWREANERAHAAALALGID